MVNMTCPVIPDKPSDPKPFFDNGNIDFKAHDVGWIVCGFMALVATISSAWLIWKHLTYYTCPQQQRHIVRLLIMVPIYAIVSFMSYLFYEQALYYQTIRDCYEAVLVTSFFYLIVAYTGDTRAEQHAVFRNLELQDRFWVWPLGSWKYKPDGLHFLWIMKICVLQYAIIRPLCTFVAVGTEYFGYYCLHSWMPWFTHVWCAFFISISVTVAMYCLIQLYMPIRKFVDPYKLSSSFSPSRPSSFSLSGKTSCFPSSSASVPSRRPSTLQQSRSRPVSMLCYNASGCYCSASFTSRPSAISLIDPKTARVPPDVVERCSTRSTSVIGSSK